MTKLAEFDINELVVQLHDELKLAFHLAQVEQLGNKFQIDTLKAKLGRKDLKVSDSDDETNLLRSDKYPNEEDWEIEVNYSRRNDFRGFEIQNSKLTDHLLLDKLQHLPLSSLKGISVYWQGIFKKISVLNFGDLSKMSEENIKTLCSNHNSFLPLEFQIKVLLLNHRIMLSDLPGISSLRFVDIILKSDQQLMSMFNNKLTKIEIAEIKNISQLLMILIDKEVFISLRLGILF